MLFLDSMLQQLIMHALQMQEHNHRRAGSYGAAGKEKGEGIGSLARCTSSIV